MQKFQFPHMGPYPAEIQVCKMTTEDQDVSFFFGCWARIKSRRVSHIKKNRHIHISGEEKL